MRVIGPGRCPINALPGQHCRDTRTSRARERAAGPQTTFRRQRDSGRILARPASGEGRPAFEACGQGRPPTLDNFDV